MHTHASAFLTSPHRAPQSCARRLRYVRYVR